MVVPYSKYQLVAWPFGLTLPFSVADVGATDDAAFVATAGAAERRERLVGAAARAGVARRDEAEVVRAGRREPAIAAATATALSPEPAFFAAVFVP